jgi:hypothetical protein
MTKVKRKNTHEPIQEVCKYLVMQDIKYESKLEGGFLKIFNKKEEPFIYYYTTGRYRKYNTLPIDLHKSSKGIHDFCVNFLNNE